MGGGGDTGGIFVRSEIVQVSGRNSIKQVSSFSDGLCKG